MNDLYIENTAVARTSCEAITAGVTYYQNLVSELKTAKTEITQNWDGDTADLTQTMTRIDMVTSVFEGKLIPSLQNLSLTVSDFADRIDENAAHDAGDGATVVTEPSSADESNQNYDNLFSGDFWRKIGSDFTDDWDFSEVDSLWSGIGALGQGVLNTAGSAVNGVGRIAGGIWDFIFG